MKKIYFPQTGFPIFGWDEGIFDDVAVEVKEQGNVMDYLSREEKILTLKKEENIKEYSYIELFEKVKPGSDCWAQFLKLIRKNVNVLVKNQDVNGLLHMLQVEQIDNVSIVEHGEKNNIASDIRWVANKSSKKGYTKIYSLFIEHEGHKWEYICTDTGCKSSCIGSVWSFRMSHRLYCAHDMATLISTIICLHLLNKQLSMCDIELHHLMDLTGVYRLSGNEDMSFLDVPVFGTEEAAKEVYGGKCCNITRIDHYKANLVFNRTAIYPDVSHLHFSGSFESDYLKFNEPYRWVNALDLIINEIADKAIARKRNKEHERQASGDYALSFMTKKHIPKKTVEAMEKSSFNDFFGFVEFDELVDITKVEEIEKEFRAFNYYLFGEQGKETRKVSLRFRRLGNHKAAGLYYPGANCICIDINNPTSFIHEYGHMLDYSNGCASESKEFKAIRQEYENLVGDDIKEKKITLKGKYNTKYYFTPTEIFARTFEIYMKKVRKMDNSILGECEGFAYPNKEHFLCMIEDYFDNFLGCKKESLSGGEVKCASI